jgi:glutathione S-transferase
VLFEKGMDFEVRDVDLFNKPEDISTMNPYGQVPILVERELCSTNPTSSTNTSTSASRIRS